MMHDDSKLMTDPLSAELSCGGEISDNPRSSLRSHWKRRLVVGVLLVDACFALPRLAHGQFLGIFDSIFSSIQSEMGGSLQAINQIRRQAQQLYQTTLWPLAALNQARGLVSNSIKIYRNSMQQIFTTRFNSAVLPVPQQFEALLHSRQSTQMAALQASFLANYGAVPPVNAASPQDRVMMDMDDALGQENLKTTLVADQGGDVILHTADQMENQIATSTPGSNPYVTAQAQVANLRCQAYMQKMLAAELRQEAGRIAHDNELVKSRTRAVGGITSLVTGALTSH
jgi:hypothetical protein